MSNNLKADPLKASDLSEAHTLPFQGRLTCSIREACYSLGLGRTKMYELIADGSLETVRIGSRRFIKVASLFTLLSMRDKSGR